MDDRDDAIIRFDNDGNLDLYSGDSVLAQVFSPSELNRSIRVALSDYETFVRCCPEMVAFIREALGGDVQYVANLSAATRKLMEEGKLFLRRYKDGKLLATLINADSNKYESMVRLKEAQQLPNVNDMMFSLSLMAITQQLTEIQEGIAELREGQKNDRERFGNVAAEYLRRATKATNQKERMEQCKKAHREAMDGFYSCLSTVKESVKFFIELPAADADASLAAHIRREISLKSISAFPKSFSKSKELRRAIAQCTQCAQYAAAASYLRGDEVEAKRDLEMYATAMHKELLGDKENHLRAWISRPKAERLPGPLKMLAANNENEIDVLICVKSTISNIERMNASSEIEAGEPDKGLEISKELMGE